MTPPPDNDASNQASARTKYLPGVLAGYFALFALFAGASWSLPADGNWVPVFSCAIIGAWAGVVLVWAGGDGRIQTPWLCGQIALGIAIDLAFNYGAMVWDQHKLLAAACTALGNLGLLMAAVGGGLLVARGLQKPSYLLMAAIVGALTDVFSVQAGPTKHIVSTPAFEFMAFSWGLVGRGGIDGIVGAGDFLFLALFFSGARRFGLDDRKTLVAMMIAIAVGFLSVLVTAAPIPALPFFAVALLLVHGRELRAQMRQG